MNSPETQDSGRPDGFALGIFVMLVLVWGLLWPAMRVATEEIPILTFRAVGSTLAFVAMALITLAAGHSLKVPKGSWLPLIIAGIFNVGAWLYLSAVGVTLIGAGRAALIAYTMPVWAFLLSIPMLGERATRWRLLGLGLAMAGLAILIGEDIRAVDRSPVGVLVMIGAAWCFAFGTVWQKRTDYKMAHLPAMTWQLFFGALPIVVIATPEMTEVDFFAFSWQAVATTLYAGLIAQVFGVAAYLWLVKRLPVKTSSLSVLLVPLVGLGSSAILLGERLGWTELIATCLIFAAIGTAFPKEKTPVVAGAPSQAKR
ncbi:MAG: DMT family transporter [Minwuia sp.]|uniref:DMT family transporter n=1 Tax=Minwuia sp. TaxID=2493630 RepID=UPI003A8B146E